MKGRKRLALVVSNKLKRLLGAYNSFLILSFLPFTYKNCGHFQKRLESTGLFSYLITSWGIQAMLQTHQCCEPDGFVFGLSMLEVNADITGISSDTSVQQDLRGPLVLGIKVEVSHVVEIYSILMPSLAPILYFQEPDPRDRLAVFSRQQHKCTEFCEIPYLKYIKIQARNSLMLKFLFFGVHYSSINMEV